MQHLRFHSQRWKGLGRKLYMNDHILLKLRAVQVQRSAKVRGKLWGHLNNVDLAECPRTMKPCQNIPFHQKVIKLMQIISCQSNWDTKKKKKNLQNTPRLNLSQEAQTQYKYLVAPRKLGLCVIILYNWHRPLLRISRTSGDIEKDYRVMYITKF